MSENAKTTAFVAVGMLAILVALATRPRSVEVDQESMVDQNLTKKFSNPDDAKSLRIVRFDEDTATLREFEVAEKDGLWTIPSKEGYPADGQRQMAEAATQLMDRKVLQVVSQNAGDHQQYGVIDPLSKIEAGAKGVGSRVTMSDINNQPLVDLIIGKEVKGTNGQHYVREAGRDLVYAIEIDPAKLSTSFEDWIEKDLLKANAWDLEKVDIHDYSAEMVPVMTQNGPRIQLAMEPRAEMSFAYNEKDGKWNPLSMRQFEMEKKEYADFKLAEDEELNAESLNALKTALDDLKIVDVVRKPAGLSNDLKAGEDFLKNSEALLDLRSKGFAAASSAAGGKEDIISSDGEVIATMNNGTEYVLRFGNLTNVGNSDQTKDETKADDPAAGEKKSDKDVNRYLFVMARFNEGAVKRPELETLPELPAGTTPPAPAAESASPPAAESATPASEEAPPATTEAKKDDGTTGGDDPAANPDPPKEETSADATDAATPPKTEPAPDTSKPAAESVPPATDASAAAPATEETKSTDEATKQQELEKLIAERKRIETENQRKLDEYQAKLKKGQETVKDLNVRFGDWYFVVDDDVFRKIRLSRENVVKKKEAKQDAAAGTSGASPMGIPGGAIPGFPPTPGAKP